MNWNSLLSAERIRQTPTSGTMPSPGDLRSAFEKDYHRIIGSASFRRLQDKTQVFPLDKSDFVRTRLTHSLEVSSFAKSLGQNIGEHILTCRQDPGFTPRMKEDICNILQCAGLIHDIGNPPFGHFGEIAIREWFQAHLPLMTFSGTPVTELLSAQMLHDFYHFEGNAQAFRLVTKLHYLVDENGMNLTFALLNTIIKYPVSSAEIQPEAPDIKLHKTGYYFADRALFQKITETTGAKANRHPLAFVLEAADDLAYKTADIEDGFVKGFYSYHTLLRELEALQTCFPNPEFQPLDKLQALYQQGLDKQVRDPEAYALKNWIVRAQSFLIHCATKGFTSHYPEIMAGTWIHDLFYQTEGEALMDLLGDMAYRRIFASSTIYKMEMVEAVVLNFLLDKFVPAILYYDTDTPPNTIDLRFISLISDNYKTAYRCHSAGKSDAEKLYLRLLLVTDYICGMTDSYAKHLYQELSGMQTDMQVNI